VVIVPRKISSASRPTHQDGDRSFDVVTSMGVTVTLGQLLGQAQAPSPRGMMVTL
jgi:hypothetical protein